jgi:chromosome transmission fidelity protein 4
MIGVVDVTDQDTHHVVNVEFHDKSADRRGYHFQDHNRFHLAAVGEQISCRTRLSVLLC